MSAAELRKAAETLRERANVATIGKWVAFGTSIGSEVKGCTCAGPTYGYPQHEQYCGIDGPVVGACEPDVAYIVAMQPDVGLALADALDAGVAQMQADDFGRPLSPLEDSLLAVARLINGGAS